MNEYHKINSIFKRDPSGKNILWGQYSLPEFDYLKDNEWVFTEKVDGTNIRVMWDGERVAFGGKTDNAQMPMPLLQRLADLFPAAPFLAYFTSPVCLYGEGFGGRIQKGGSRYGDQQDFVLFDAKIGDNWMAREEVEAVALGLNCAIVPVVGSGTLGEMVERCRSAFPSQWGDFPAEGIVARPPVELRGRYGQRIVTKFKLRDFG